jgi:PEGA domain-containing protein
MHRAHRYVLLLTFAVAIPAVAAAQAVPRGSTSSGSSSSGSSSSGGSSGGGSSDTSSPPPPPPPPPPVEHVRTPPPDGSRSGSAVPRGSSSSSNSNGNSSSATARTSGVASGSGDASSSTSGSSDASSYNDSRSRNRNGRVPTGAAVSRDAVYGGGGGDWYPVGSYSPWYSYNYIAYDPFLYGYSRWNAYRYGGWYNPYSLYGYYDPWYMGMYDPFYSGYYSSYGSSSYGSGGYSSSRSSRGQDEATGSLRLKVNPAKAQVYLDGTLMGLVDDFDGLTGGHLAATSGVHELEFRADGYQTATTRVTVESGKTVTARVAMKKK